MDPVLFRLPFGPLQVRYYGVIFSLVFVGGYLLYRWQTRRAGYGDDLASELLVPGFIGLLLGARLGHALFYNFDLLKADPLWFFKVWEGGLTSHGAAVGLIAALWWHARRKGLPLLDAADRFSFSAALGAGLVRLGNFFNSEIVGKPTQAFWAVRFPRYDGLPADFCPPRYPSQLVECALGLGLLGALLAADRLMGREARPRGALAALFLILYFSGRFLVEFLKERQGPFDDLWLSRGQLLSLPGVALGLATLTLACRRRRSALGGGADAAQTPPKAPAPPCKTPAKAAGRRRKGRPK
ncbi:MAG: prolipoprotein diacylglyceryl transferase [Deltaproteobacteria bacterium]|nr:prolipoprotein diacylglyceryl transferase [Deltaproteobacteria bacterium]